MPGERLTKHKLLFAALLLLAGFALFRPALKAPFLYDDQTILQDNGAFCGLKSLGHLFSGDYMPFFKESSWHPLVTAVQIAVGTFFGGSPFAFHLLNVFLHCLCAFLAGLCAFQLFKNRPVAIAASVLFLAHPLHVEPLIVATFNEDIFAAFFSLLALLAALKKDERSGEFTRAIPVFFALALLSKESSVFFPLVLAAAGAEKIKKELILCGKILLVYIFFCMMLSDGSGGLDLSGIEPNILPKLALYSLNWFLPLELSSFYSAPTALRAAAGLALLAAVVPGAYLPDRRTRPVAVSSLLILSGLAAHLNILPLSALTGYLGDTYAADRYAYLPSAGLAWLTAASLWAAASHAPARLRSFTLISLLAAAGLAAATLGHQRLWLDQERLWERAVLMAPGSSRATLNLGHFRSLGGSSAEAVFFMRKSISLTDDPFRKSMGAAKLGLEYLKSGDTKRALPWLKAATALSPRNVLAVSGLCSALTAAGRSQEAEEIYKKAIARYPRSALLHQDLGRLYLLKEDYGKALRELQTAAGTRTAPETYSLLADAFLGLKNADKAEEYYLRALKADPRRALTFLHLGRCFLYSGKVPQAVETFKSAAAMDKKDPVPRLELAGIYARRGEKEKALEELRTALALGFKDRAFIEQENAFDSLRSNRGFQDLVNSLKKPRQ